MRKKLRSARGETLIEVLCAILVGSLSVALLFSMVVASGKMDRNAREADKNFVASLNAAEGRAKVKNEAGADVDPPVADDAKVTVWNTADMIAHPGDKSFEANPPVKFYGGKGAISYALDAPGGSPP